MKILICILIQCVVIWFGYITYNFVFEVFKDSGYFGNLMWISFMILGYQCIGIATAGTILCSMKE